MYCMIVFMYFYIQNGRSITLFLYIKLRELKNIYLNNVLLFEKTTYTLLRFIIIKSISKHNMTTTHLSL